MGNEEAYVCIDAGTENCPCYLALTGDCLTCNRLQGKESCDCNWRGVCIYNEFVQLDHKVNNPRTNFLANIVERKFYLDDLVIFVLDVGKGFAIKASHPGSYLFMRKSSSNYFYELPISVMYTDLEKGYLHLAVKLISLKTKSLLEEEEAFVLRGIYRNGIQGVSALSPKGLKGKRVLLLAKGIGIAPAILTATCLKEVCRVDLVVDTEKISTQLISDYIKEDTDSGKTVKYLSLGRPEDQKELKRILRRGSYDSVAVLASDYYEEVIGELVKKVLPTAKLAKSNNFRICCGEGVCGACTSVNAGGETIKMCKCQRIDL